MNGLPNSWQSAKLGDVCEPSQYGYTAKAGSSGNLHFLRTTDITAGHINWDSVPFCIADDESSIKYLLHDGDVVISRAGSVGFSCLIRQPRPSVFASYLIRFRPLINADYFKYFLLTPDYWNAIGERSLGIAVQNVNASRLSEIDIPVAPLNEQNRIVARLDELLSDLDAGVAELKAAQKKLTRYRQSLLKAAVEGALTAEWRASHKHTETGVQLLESILTERRTRWETKQLAKFAEQGKTPPRDWRQKYLEPIKPCIADLPELPEGWVWASIDQLSEFITSGSRGWADYYSDAGAIFIRSQNINKDWLDLSDIAFVNPPHSAEGARTLVQKDDVLLTITGANVGKAAHVEDDIVEAYVSQHVALIRPVNKALSKVLHLFLTAEAGGRGTLNKYAYGAGKPGLNLQQIAGVCVPLAGEDEFKVLLDIFNFQLTEITSKKLAVELAIKKAFAQRQNILRTAFSGQLLPQDTNDEPASVLLERIYTERVQRDTGKKLRSRKITAKA